ncbi:MAG: excinuclease ABC subunit UvrC [Bacillota bacterium]|nr:excinuclease ABC subunit UvrC [Bacillota bacterium]
MEQEHWRELLKGLPDRPGVYLFKDAAGQVVYVGKALSLRNRVRSYFHSSAGLNQRTMAMLSRAAGLDWIVTDTELEALTLESNLVKRHRPRYNVMLKDDKHYPYLRVTTEDRWPRLVVARRARRDGSRYFGPYYPASVVHETMRLCRRLFPLRTCSDRALGNTERPCLNYHIGRCLGPCTGQVDADEYRQVVRDLCLFLGGRGEEVRQRLRARMEEAAGRLEFEKAARLRDQIQALDRLIEEQKMVSTGLEDQDVVGLARAGGDVCLQVFFMRAGKVVGRRHYFLPAASLALAPGASEGTGAGTAHDAPGGGNGRVQDAEILAAFLKQHYADTEDIPAQILLPSAPEESDLIGEWLTRQAGHRVSLVVPRKGEKRRLVELVTENARQVLNEIKPEEERRREMGREAARVLGELAGLVGPVHRLEGYDISNLQGRQAVGSLVVFEDGVPRKEHYRLFRLRTPGPDDYAMMQEVLFRRFRRGLQEAGSGSSWATMPDLVLVDGGRGQLNAALEVLRALDLERIPAMGLAKEQELLFLPDRPEAVELPRDSAALHLVQWLRDEAHRFALGHHRRARKREGLRSLLDEVPGIGPRRKKELLRHFGSLEKLVAASVEELAAVPGMNRAAARRLKEYLGEA